MTEAQTIRIATWNIHMGVGPDGKRDLDRIASIILDLGVDCIALQEVDNRIVAGRPGELVTLARKTGYEAISGPTMHREDGNYGNALLTRLPVDEIRLEELSVAEFEPRGLIDADLLFNGHSLRVVTTHLGLRRAERRRQIRRILGHLQTYPDHATILLGDFNEWWPWSRNLRFLKSRFRKSLAPATFSSRWPHLALDRIFVSSALRIRSLKVDKTPTTRSASDHLPVTAVIELRPDT
jgi:endonuclease/exonuclease/phosphatase family metal-dependent hydrolase